MLVDVDHSVRSYTGPEYSERQDVLLATASRRRTRA